MKEKDWRERLKDVIPDHVFVSTLFNTEKDKKKTTITFPQEGLEDFITEIEQQAYERGVEDENSWRCPYCIFITKTKGQLRHHIKVRHEDLINKEEAE